MRQIFEHITLEDILQFIEGDADPEISVRVQSWLDADNANQAYLRKIKEAWGSISNLKDFDQSTVDADWANVLAKINEKKAQTIKGKKVNLLHGYNVWLRVAVVFILAVFLSGILYILNRHFSIGSGEIAYNEIVVPKGQRSQLVLSDGTKIWINAGSKLKFPLRFNGKIREVWLQGEAYFEVAKNPSKPFFVRTHDLNIKVWGTEFNVKSYEDEGITETTLVKGLVSIQKKDAKGVAAKEVFLKPNHKAIYVNDESVLHPSEKKKLRQQLSEPIYSQEIQLSEPIKTDPDVSWIDGKLVFENETFENIMQKIERKYDVRIVLLNEQLKNARFTGVLKNIPVEQTLRALQLTTPFSYSIKDNEIIIKAIRAN
ncbi:MAG: DUF4974 domain-containing protein [Bacteroidota bacterium]|nr:DUF4974 domain-containing protein [Bacteroidota bacterium]